MTLITHLCLFLRLKTIGLDTQSLGKIPGHKLVTLMAQPSLCICNIICEVDYTKNFNCRKKWSEDKDHQKQLP